MPFFSKKKNTFTYWTKHKTEKLLATAKHLIICYNLYVCCFKKSSNFFHRVNVQIDLTTLPLPAVCLCSLFKDLFSPSTTNILFEVPLENIPKNLNWHSLAYPWALHRHFTFSQSLLPNSLLIFKVSLKIFKHIEYSEHLQVFQVIEQNFVKKIFPTWLCSLSLQSWQC